MNQTVMQAAALILPLVFALVFHEVAHGWVARALGDPTASELNRLSLNPLRHVDPVGTVILPGMLALAKAPVFGWAKPVPIDARRLRNPRRDMMLVAAAGPGMNLAMGALSAVLLGLLARAYGGVQEPTGPVLFVRDNLINFIQLNVFLALFNLIPIPPFDGSHIMEGLLPRALARPYAKIRQLGMLLPILLLIVLPSLIPSFDLLQVVYGPFEWVIGLYRDLAAMVSGGW